MQRTNNSKTTEPPSPSVQTGRFIAPSEENTQAARNAALGDLKRLVAPPQDCPVEALKTLYYAACHDTGGSQAARNFLFWLAGRPDPTGYKGNGGIELRRLDRELKQACLEVFRWWSGPTASDEPLYALLRELGARFGTPPAGGSLGER